MASEKNKPSGIEDLLREKEKIEKSIKDAFQEYVTILFTDISGYTRFVETHGDIAAKALLQKHNEILFPIIETHSGKVIKTIGDAVMASFSDTKNAVTAAVEIQNALKRHNEQADRTEKILIRIGINAGTALRDGNDYFGDAVNVAARIEPAGTAGQILVSRSVYDALKEEKGFFIGFHGMKEAKGKSEPLELYRVFLDPDEMDRAGKADHAGTITGFAKPVTRYGLMWKISLPFTLILVLLFVYPGFLYRIDLGSDGQLKKYVDGFMYLRNGEFEQARLKFLDIGENSARAQEGLAALAYKTRKPSEAETRSQKTLELDQKALYARVIQGNLLFDGGKLDEAGQVYTEAVNFDAPLDWQKGEAYFRLGRISSFQENPSKALAYYDKAVQYDAQNTDIMTAKGILLEKMGELNKALESFQAAQQLSPEDPFVKAFYKSVQEKMAARNDKERQERIDSLIQDLVADIQANGRPAPADTWTSRPVTLFFAKMERKGTIPVREGQDEFFQMELTEGLRGIPTVEVVDRELLDKLLQELKMSSSDLADPATALKLGRIMSARLIGDLTFIGFENETRIYVKLIETETSRIKVSLTDQFDPSVPPDQVVRDMVKRLAEDIKAAFPIRGRLEQVQDGEVVINIGSALGLAPGMILKVYDDAGNTLVGAVKVVVAEKDRARGEIIDGRDGISARDLVEAAKI